MSSRAECCRCRALALPLAFALFAACGGQASAVEGSSEAGASVSSQGSATTASSAVVGGSATAARSGGVQAAVGSTGSAGASAAAAIGGTPPSAQSAAGSSQAPQATTAAGSGGAMNMNTPTPTTAASAMSTSASGAAGSSSGASTSSAAGSGADAPSAPDASGPTAGAEPASCQGGDPSKAPVIYVIGDSTASVYEAKLYPRMGWAQPLQEYFKPACATVQDKALSGRSSKSFLDEGAWTPIRAALHEGDFVIIQFGHNDEKSDDAARYTEPFGSYQEHLSRYIDDTLAAKATPILMTSIERNKWSSGKLGSTHGDYPEAVRQLAQKRQLTLVDMTKLTHDYLQGIGQDASTKLFMNLAPGESPNYPSGNSDDTHLQDKGAHKVADIALADLARQRAPIAALLDHVPTP